MAYINHSYNDSPVIHGEANAALTAPAMKAFAFNASGKVILPATSGDFAVGIALANTDDVAAGGGIDLQIKDGCLGIAGETVKKGDLLMAHTDGTLKKATAGKNVLAIALTDAASGKPVQVFITRGIMPPIVCDFSTPPTDGQVLKWDNTNKVWKPGNDAT